MTTNAVFAQGTLFKVGDGAGPEVFTTVAEARSISGPSLTRATVDVTTHDSVGGFREYMGALGDGGTVSFDINYRMTEATHNNATGILGKLMNNIRSNFKLVFPDIGATTWNMSGFVTSFEASEPVDNVVTASIEIKLSGKPTVT